MAVRFSKAHVAVVTLRLELGTIDGSWKRREPSDILRLKTGLWLHRVAVIVCELVLRGSAYLRRHALAKLPGWTVYLRRCSLDLLLL